MKSTCLCWARVSRQINPDAICREIRVAVIGPPNVGKSSLTNKLVRNEVCAVSKVIDTTRQNWITNLNEDNVQLTVIDSPGLIGLNHAKNVINTHSESKIMVDPEKAFRNAEHVLVVHDVTAPGKYIHHRVLHLLHRNCHIPSSLVLNKIDLIPTRAQLLELTHTLTYGNVDNQQIPQKRVNMGGFQKILDKKETFTINPMANFMHGKSEKWKIEYNRVINKATHKCAWNETKNVFQAESGWPHFQNVFFVSCHNGEGVDNVRNFLKEYAKRSDTNMTAQDTRAFKQKLVVIVAEHIRAAFLNTIPSDVAYRLKIHVVDIENLGDEINVTADVICEKERWAKLVNSVLSQQTRELEKHFSKLFKSQVQLQIHTKHQGKLVIPQE